jgi:tRNA(Phe) wybutosine-synthesizing methylase Tyw3
VLIVTSSFESKQLAVTNKSREMSTNKIFSNQKQAAFAGQDLSRKGSVDEPIKELVDFINSLASYFTTSSCSGRIVVLADTPEEVKLVFYSTFYQSLLLKF